MDASTDPEIYKVYVSSKHFGKGLAQDLMKKSLSWIEMSKEYTGISLVPDTDIMQNLSHCTLIRRYLHWCMERKLSSTKILR